ncbi:MULTISPECIES: zeta toxin family protein [unclassified Arthrobacter]|uniref:zeta toxin family protein n=1 Tax=unclassified Arthrobacter TaxID=235627 RepID=UPI0028830D5D|nr:MULTISPECIES: zeta toxin family protein [unclassified Arthrobacter]
MATRPDLKAALFKRVLNGQHTFTEHVYRDEGDWHPERRDLQDELVARRSGADASAPAQPGKGAVYVLIGLPGSGKTSALRPLVFSHAGLDPSEVSVSDADELRVEFPEYASGLGSGVVQDECSELMYTRQIGTDPLEPGLQGAILETGQTTIIDVIGHEDYLPQMVTRLRRNGRRVFVLHASCATETCMQRAKVRALQTGRLVPLWMIESKRGMPERALEAAKSTGKLSGWAVVDTSGEVPRVIESHRFEVAA